MAASVPDLTANQDKKAVSADLYTLLGALFGYPLALQPGEPIPAVLDVVTGWFVDEIWNPLVVPALCAPFLDFSTGDWLGNFAFGTYDRERILTEAATGPITIENRTGGFVATQAAGQVRIKSSASGKTYTNTTPITFDSSSPYPLGTGTFEADEEGTGSNANPGDIAAYPTALVVGPVGCYAQTNVGPLLGSDGEEDPLLVERCRLAPAELSAVSPPNAYASVCLDPLGAFARRQITPPSTWGTAAPAITRVGVREPGNSTIDVDLASASGPAAGSVSVVDSDVYKAWLACTLILPAGFTLNVAAAVVHNIGSGITVTVYIDRASRVSQSQGLATANAGSATFFRLLAIGGKRTTPGGQGYVFADAVIAALGSGPGVIDVGFSSGFVDVALAANEVAVPAWAAIQVQLVTQ